MIYRVVIVLVFAISLAACSDNRTDSEGTTSTQYASELTQTRWQLAEVLGTTVSSSDATEERPYLMLQDADGEKFFSAYAGCNQIGGRFALDSDHNLRFEALRSTQMSCEEMELEEKLIEALKQTEQFEIINEVMILGRSRMAPLARFEAK